jgi:RNA ligase
VFEGLNPSLRIVVDYGKRSELVLLSVIDIETGGEAHPRSLGNLAAVFGCAIPELKDLTLEQAASQTLEPPKDGLKEGYVLTWYRDGKPPFRLKMKFIEYLKLHRMVTGVSPKRVWEVLATNQSSELNEWIQNSTPWFAAFAKKWMTALRAEYDRIMGESYTRFECAKTMLGTSFDGPSAWRKAYALEFNKPKNKEFAPVMFALLDNKDPAPVIWKIVRRMTTGVGPMVDAHNT